MRAVRLIFEYDGDQMRLVSQQSVDVAVTGLDLTRAPHPGVYVDARDAGGTTLARVPAHHALSGSAEVFPEKAGDPIVRTDVVRPKGAFTVVIPAPAETQQLTVMRVAHTHPNAQLPADATTTRVSGGAEVVDLATFELQLKP